MFRRKLIIILGSLILTASGFSQNLSVDQSLLFKGIATFLNNEGLEPKIEENGLISFEYQGCTYEIHIDAQDVNPMFITMGALFELPPEYSYTTVSLAANELNNTKGVKVLCHEDSFAVQADMFLTRIDPFIDSFYPILSHIQSVLLSFVDACANVSQSGSSRNSNTANLNEATTTSSPIVKKEGTKSKSSNAAEEIYYNPKVTGQLDRSAIIKKVVITDEYTFIEVRVNSTSAGTTHEWCNIDAATYLVIEDKPFEKIKLTRASGIQIAPEKTYFGGANKSISFKLYFPSIPKDTKSISLIEPDSSWCFFGITLHK